MTDEAPRTWQPIDLESVLDGRWQPPEPAIGARTDGIGLLYPGKTHTVSSESEAGKTWLAMAIVVDELSAGRHVCYIDFEDDEGAIAARLLTLQVAPDMILDRFHYIRPSDPLAGIHVDDLRGVYVAHKPALTVIDGVTEAMTMHGLNPLDNTDVAKFGRTLPRKTAAAGSATVCLDHVNKDRENRGRYAMGGVHKLNGLDGAAYVLENRQPFGIGLTGRSTIRIAKDRPGRLRRHALPSAGLQWFGDLVLTSHDESFAEVTIEPPHERDENFRPTVMMERVAKALGQHMEGLSKRRLRVAVPGKNESIDQALDYLIHDGFACESTPHKLLKPYPEGGSES